MQTIEHYEKATKLKDADFKQLIGVSPKTFDTMTKIPIEAYTEKHKRRSRYAKRSIQDQLFITLKYLRQYVTQKELAYEFAIGEATTYDVIVWIEHTLIKSGMFSLPGKKALLKDNDLKVVIVDVMESPIQRPKKTA